METSNLKIVLCQELIYTYIHIIHIHIYMESMGWGEDIIVNYFSTAVAVFQGCLLSANLLAPSWNMSQGRYFWSNDRSVWKISIWCMSVIASLQMLIPCLLQAESRCQLICECSFLLDSRQESWEGTL